MSRDPFTDPRAGDVFDVPKFGGGCRVTILKRAMFRKGVRRKRGADGPTVYSFDGVHVRIRANDGHHVNQQGRVWSMATWGDVLKGATVVARGEP